MAGDILTDAADYDMVRAMLRVSETFLPDEVIEYDIHLTLTEALVKKSFSTWETIKSDAGVDWTLLRVGTAAVLAYYMVDWVERDSGYNASWRIDQYSEGASNIDWQIVKDELRTRAWTAFSAMDAYVYNRPTIFLTHGPSSTGYNVPDDWDEWLEKILPDYVNWGLDDDED
jgi:hypothetical protein